MLQGELKEEKILFIVNKRIDLQNVEGMDLIFIHVLNCFMKGFLLVQHMSAAVVTRHGLDKVYLKLILCQ